MKQVKLILACDNRGLIGNGSKIPWYFSEDFKHFKETTAGSTVMMGRKTWESLPRKPLPGRDNYILSRNMRLDQFALEMPSVDVFVSVEDAYADWQKKHSETKDLFVIGGAQIYHEALSKLPVSEVWLTLVYGDHEGDTFFDMEYLKDEVWNIDIIKKTENFEIQRWRLAGS